MTAKPVKKLWASIILSVMCLIIAGVIPGCSSRKIDDGQTVDEPHFEIEDSVTPSNNGTLSVKLMREKLETRILDSHGFPTRHTYRDEADFTHSKENVFGLNEDMLVAPTCWFEASMAISNTDGFDFEYWIEIRVADAEDEALAEQLKLTVKLDGETVYEDTLDDGVFTPPLCTVTGSDISYFSVKLEYIDHPENDKTKDSEMMFDMIVHARLV